MFRSETAEGPVILHCLDPSGSEILCSREGLVASVPEDVTCPHCRVLSSSDGATKDMVNHPDHYGGADDPYEVIKVIRAWGLGFDLGNAVKYIARAGKKNPEKHIEDLEKAVFYLQDEIKHLKSKAARQ